MANQLSSGRPRNTAALQLDEVGAHLRGIDPGAAGDDEDQAAEDGQRAQRHDDRRNIELPDQEAVERAQRPRRCTTQPAISSGIGTPGRPH